MLNFEVLFYQKNDGKIPVEEFILSQNLKVQAKIFRYLELLEKEGNNLREPFSRPVGEGIFEIRPHAGGVYIRILYFFISGGKVIVTNGFIKKTNKTPSEQIELAKKYRADYLNEREDKHE